MRGDYEPDTFTENEVLQALEGANLRYRNGARYILSQCPTHEDKHPSVQIYKDDWFVNCHAGCGRFHITKAFPDLRSSSSSFRHQNTNNRAKSYRSNRQNEEEWGAAKMNESKQYKKIDQIDYWRALPLIPRDHYFKNIPLDVLDSLGWRWVSEKNSYLIPYFSRSKKSVPFSQLRHLTGDRRFTFLKDAKPTMYGTWNLDPGQTVFLVEGASDAAVLEHCMIPWVAAPSAASGELVKQMAVWCSSNHVKVVYAGDNDLAGDKLREALDSVMMYRVRQPRPPYKDWGEMFEAEGVKSVINWCHAELYPSDPLPYPEIEPGYIPGYIPDFRQEYQEYPSTPEEAAAAQEKTPLEKVQAIMPGAKQLKIVGVSDVSEQLDSSPTEPTPLF